MDKFLKHKIYQNRPKEKQISLNSPTFIKVTESV